MRNIWLAAVAGIVATPAMAVGHLADVAVVDRGTGERLEAHLHKGEYWVVGRPGAHYAIQIQSRDGARLLAVTSVDGVNVVTGETAGHHQRGYVFAPWQGYDIAGWRKSDAEIAAFTFTSIPRSYAARTGRPDNVGVIGVAVFREKPRPVTGWRAPPPVSTAPAAEPWLEERSATARQRGNATASAADSAARESVAARQTLPAPGLGTGHGRREHSLVTQVAFERARDMPDEVIRIRYDSHANLLALGVIRRSDPKPRQLDPFPGSRLGYVPDP